MLASYVRTPKSSHTKRSSDFRSSFMLRSVWGALDFRNMTCSCLCALQFGMRIVLQPFCAALLVACVWVPGLLDRQKIKEKVKELF